MALSFKGHTVVVTGAGGGLGKAYSLLFASRGANVVVNDVSEAAASKVVDEIRRMGGSAVTSVASVTDGELIIKTAVEHFGTVTILINNAGILRFKNMSDKEWDFVQLVHLKGAFSCTKAAWPVFVKQKFGRIINTASAAGLYGNNGQANYSAAKMGLVGFTKTLALEGEKYGIKASVIAPMAASAMTETVMPPDMLAGLKPEFVAPLVAALAHPDGPEANGRLFEVGAGFVAEVRWERSHGVHFRLDETFTPSAIAAQWDKITDFENPEHPMRISDTDLKRALDLSKASSPNPQSSPEIRFDGKTVIVTAAGAGLGSAYALMFGKLGANVVVNDTDEANVNAVVSEINKAGGKAVPSITSTEDGEGIVKTALDAFGGVHVLVTNARVLRSKPFGEMSEADWDEVVDVNIRGSFRCAKAVWPIFQKQKYGRIITTASNIGIYGAPSLANYSTAKAAIIGFTKTLAIEGARSNILANVVASTAPIRARSPNSQEDLADIFKSDYLAPVLGYLASEANEETTGSLLEVAGGWAAQTRWQRAGGFGFPHKKPLTPEAVISKWNKFTNFDDGRATNPASTHEALQQIIENFENENEEEEYADPDDPDVVVEAKKIRGDPEEYSYEEKDVILYNLSVGATEKELPLTYEGDSDFRALPTFGVIPAFASASAFSLDWLPNYNPAKLLHGEQYLAIKAPIPTSGTLVTTTRVLEVLDKGKAASVRTISETKDPSTGEIIFENVMTVFVRGSGGFGGKKTGNELDFGPITAANEPPQRKPDAVAVEKTNASQAALYRLNGDLNPLHILPEFAAIGGYSTPILHGLCSFGIAGKHVFKTFGEIKDIKARFAGVVYPGETLVTEMWKENDKVIFNVKVKERESVVLAAAGATLLQGTSESLPLKSKL
ncbi:peroxisomal hydratase-dehydrogenase-epimerase [Sistotremastrum niveocremeum HHB9708]|uniref:Peroxisomal hydratase-dehydrogenase-epimerase n=1 Tax=Sistotremastrum niveocremeum HHB9708 TaxID=1314777 RepID=A0A164TJV8_9AGAM|nr:peroxisomal hydratase-dehydrogenase-epimerase [Sistotremastrum niveocremeum HHB9708]